MQSVDVDIDIDDDRFLDDDAVDDALDSCKQALLDLIQLARTAQSPKSYNKQNMEAATSLAAVAYKAFAGSLLLDALTPRDP